MTNDAWVQPFLTSLAATGIVSRACEAAQVSRTRVMAMKDRDGDFKAAFEDAMERAVDMAEAEAWRRAIHGVTKPVLYKGHPVYKTRMVEVLDPDTLEPTGETRFEFILDDHGQPIPYLEHEYSDTLLAKILGAHRKAFSTERTELTGPDGGAVQLDSGKRAERTAALLALAEQRRKAANEHSDIA